MNAREVKMAIAQADARIPELEDQVDKLTRARKALLVSDEPDDQRLVSHVEQGGASYWFARSTEARALMAGWDGQGLRDKEAELERLKERRELLVAKLPTPAEIEAAEKEAAEILEAQWAAEAEFATAWAELTEHLDRAADAAEIVSKARRMALRHQDRAREVATRFGLDLASRAGSRAIAEPSPDEVRHAGAAADVARQAAYHQHVDETALLQVGKVKDRKAA